MNNQRHFRVKLLTEKMQAYVTAVYRTAAALKTEKCTTGSCDMQSGGDRTSM